MRNPLLCYTFAASHHVWKIIRPSFFVALVSLCNAGWAQSALEPLQVGRKGSWTSGLYININSRRALCAMETSLADGSVFRINYYAPRNVFLEVATGEQITHDTIETEVTFIGDKRPAMTLPAFFEANFMVVEMNNQAVAGELLQVIARAQTLTVTTREASLFEVPVNGSASALEMLLECVRALGRH